MARSIGVTLSAVLLFLVSLLSLACGTLTSATMLFGELPRTAPFHWAKYVFVGYVLLILLITIWEMSTAIGLFWLQRWARISMLVAGGFMVFFGLTSLPVVFVLPSLTGSSQRSFLPVAIGMGIFYSLLTLLGGWWIYLFTRPSIKEQFSRAIEGGVTPVDSPPARPLSITVIAWILLLTWWMVPAMSWLNLPIVLLGFVLTGAAAVVADWVYGLLMLYIGIGLLRRQRVAHTLAVCYFAFVILNGLVVLVSPGYEEVMAIFTRSLPEDLQAYANTAPVMPKWIPAMMGLTPSVVQLWFLVTRRKALLQRHPGSPESSAP